jgi:hypothetical protein
MEQRVSPGVAESLAQAFQSPALEHGTGMSREPADKNVCATGKSERRETARLVHFPAT